MTSETSPAPITHRTSHSLVATSEKVRLALKDPRPLPHKFPDMMTWVCRKQGRGKRSRIRKVIKGYRYAEALDNSGTQCGEVHKGGRGGGGDTEGCGRTLLSRVNAGSSSGICCAICSSDTIASCTATGETPTSRVSIGWRGLEGRVEAGAAGVGTVSQIDAKMAQSAIS